jgi:two-component system, chemotaxis family, chemotaxis protein CheY
MMSATRVLSLGQCGADHWSLATLFARHFSAEVVGVDTFADARAELAKGGIRLVLVNRLLDRDGSSGLDFIAELKRDAALAAVPVMLVSNYHDAQRQAVALGALPGFGKAGLGDTTNLERLRQVLAPETGGQGH